MIKKIAITLRFLPDLHQALKEEAARDERSLTGEVFWVLKQFVEDRQRRRRYVDVDLLMMKEDDSNW